jgi:cell division protein FtsB
MTEETQRKSEVRQKRVVGRTIAIGLGLVCLVLAAALIGVVAIYLSNQTTNAAATDALKVENANLKGNQTSLIQQISNLQTSLSQARDEIASKDADIADYNSAYLGLLNVLNMNASATILPTTAVPLDAGTNVTVFDTPPLEYAGLVTVQVTSSSNTTYAQVRYVFSGYYFDNVVVVGQSGTAAFAVLPGNVEVIIGNTELSTAVTSNVAVTYIY